MALLLTSTSLTKDYCEGFVTCTWDEKAIYFDLSQDLWKVTRGRSVREAADRYCADHVGSKVYVDLGDNDVIEGTCER